MNKSNYITPVVGADGSDITLYVQGRQIGGWTRPTEFDRWTLTVNGWTVCTASESTPAKGLIKIARRRVQYAGTVAFKTQHPAAWVVADNAASRTEAGQLFLLVDELGKVHWRKSITSAQAADGDYMLALRRKAGGFLGGRTETQPPRVLRSAAAAARGISSPRPAAESIHSGQVKKWDTPAEYAMSAALLSVMERQRKKVEQRRIECGEWGLRRYQQ